MEFIVEFSEKPVIPNLEEYEEHFWNGKNHCLKIYDNTDVRQEVGIRLEQKYANIDSPIFMSFTKEEARLLGKSLLALTESMDERWKGVDFNQ